MQIDKLVVRNYKSLKDIIISMNAHTNIFVGENDSGKSTILEALCIVLTGKLDGVSIMNRFTLDWFNTDCRNKYIQAVASANPSALPEIVIEAYFCEDMCNDDSALRNFKGTNNSLREDALGVKVEFTFDEQYAPAYRSQLAEQAISDIPIEYYRVNYRSFANPEYYINATSKKVAYIDTTRKDYGQVLNRFVTSSLSYLSDEDVTSLRHAYRANRHNFTNNSAVTNLNQKLQSEFGLERKTVSLNLREQGVDSWKSEMSLSLDGIPLENVGYGTQNMFKSEMFVRQNPNIDLLIIEEPENNLSYSNMSILISQLSRSTCKQLFISTHSSFVANKLGLQNLQLVSNGAVNSLASMNEKTYEYFLKLPGYNTLRLLLANKLVLVEGPADELIIQRAYFDAHSKLPIEDGMDVMAVGGVAFKRYCELAQLVGKSITIVTDNDRDAAAVIERYSSFGDLVSLCVERDNSLYTLEPSVLAANQDKFDDFRGIIYRGKDIGRISYDELCAFMVANKTEWSMRVFQSESRISYPSYILDAIGMNTNEE